MKTTKLIYYILPFMMLYSASINAQEFSWARAAGYFAFDYGYGVCADDNGNIYVAGKFEEDAIFGDTIAKVTNNHDIFTAKYDHTGKFQWVRTAGGQWGDYAKAVTCDGAGNIFVVGEMEMTIQFYGTNTTLSTWGDNDIFIARYNTNGELIWAQRAGGKGNDKPHAVVLDGNFLYVAGKIEKEAYFDEGAIRLTTDDSDDIFLAKYDINGKFYWVRQVVGPGEDEAMDVTVDADRNVYITGFVEGDANFSGTTIKSKGNKDIFIAKYSPDGNLIWVKNDGGLRNDAGYGIVAAPDGRIYVTGGFREKSTFGNIEMTAIKGDLDVFIACYSKDGEIIWVKKGGGDINDNSFAIACDSESNVYITGYYGAKAEFGGQFITAADSADIFVAKYTKDGELGWLMSVDGIKDHEYKMGTEEAGRAIWVDKFNNVIVAGSFRSDAMFGNHYLQGWMNSDIFVAKIKQPGSTEPDFTSVAETELKNYFEIYPNPTQDYIFINYWGNDQLNLRVEIQTIQGQVMIQKDYTCTGGHKQRIALNDLAQGIYFVKITSAEGQHVQKIVVR
jgi:hypothetical protein